MQNRMQALPQSDYMKLQHIKYLKVRKELTFWSILQTSEDFEKYANSTSLKNTFCETMGKRRSELYELSFHAI